MIHALEELYRKDLRTEMNDITDATITGRDVTLEEFKYMQGVVRGLAVAERLFLDRVAQIKEQDNDF
jgi:hypothetical protein